MRGSVKLKHRRRRRPAARSLARLLSGDGGRSFTRPRGPQNECRRRSIGNYRARAPRRPTQYRARFAFSASACCFCRIEQAARDDTKTRATAE